MQSELGLEESECVVADVANADLADAFAGCSKLVVATSATPKIDPWSLPGVLFNKYIMRKKQMPRFTFTQMPEKVCDLAPRGLSRLWPNVACVSPTRCCAWQQQCDTDVLPAASRMADTVCKLDNSTRISALWAVIFHDVNGAYR